MEELDLKELFLMFWNKRYLILLITLIAMFVGVVYSYFLVVPEYKSYTTLVLAQSSSNTGNSAVVTITQADLTLNSKLVSTYSELIKSKTIVRQVVDFLNNDSIDEIKLKKEISVQAVKDTELIEITVKDKDPNLAAQIANKIAEAFSEKVVEIYNISNVYILDRAEANEIPCNINHKKTIAIFTFMGIVISAGVVFLYSILDTTIKSEQDIENTTGLLILSSIPNYDIENKRKKGVK